MALKGLVTAVLIVALGAGPVVWLQKHIDQFRASTPPSQELLYIPNGSLLRPAVLGYDSMVADLLWLRAISLFGERFRGKQDPIWLDWLDRMLDVATDLDPLDHRIYLYGGIMLKVNPSHRAQASKLFEKGTRNVPTKFFLPFGVAMIAMEDENDLDKAIEFMKIASGRPDAPFYLKALVGTMMQRNRQDEVALAFLEEELRNLAPNSAPWKAVFVEYSEARYDFFSSRLTDSVDRFKQAFGRYPEPLEEILGVTLKADKLPPEPYGSQWSLDPATHRVVGINADESRRKLREQYGFNVPGVIAAAPSSGKSTSKKKTEKSEGDGTAPPATPQTTSAP